MTNSSDVILSAIDRQKANFEEVHRYLTSFRKDSKSRYNRVYFEVKADILQTKWRACTDLHQEVVHAKRHNPTLLEDYLKEFEEVETRYEEHIIQFRSAIKDFDTASTTMHTASNSNSGAISANGQQRSGDVINIDTVPLERIKVPKFNGEYIDWAAFHDLFKVMVHDNVQLSAVQKMQYLKSSVSGEAAVVIKHLITTEDNYSVAWELIQRRFDNPRAVANSLMKLFWTLKGSGASTEIVRTMLNVTSEVINSVKALEADTIDIFMVYFLQQRLDTESNVEWQKAISGSTAVPTVDQFIKFLTERLAVLEAIHGKSNKPKTVNVFSTTAKPTSCEFCKGEHRISQCTKFLAMELSNRREFVKKSRLCYNCLGNNHNIAGCPSKARCKRCSKKHHSTLHTDGVSSPDTHSERTLTLTAGFREKYCLTLLATARVFIQGKSGSFIPLRALVDQGSQKSFITHAAAQTLGLPRSYNKFAVHGIGEGNVMTKGVITVNCKDKWSAENIQFNLHVLPTIALELPQRRLGNLVDDISRDHLADPDYNVPGKIEILLGADSYSSFIEPGLKKVITEHQRLVAQRTRLGWIISGPTSIVNSNRQISMVNLQDLESSIKRFWELEEVDTARKMSPAEADCSKHYSSTTERQDSGRYIVRLAFNEENPGTSLLESRKDAIIRLRQMESRLERNEELKIQYNGFLQEYLELGHMEEIPSNEVYKNPSNYLPHHAVIKASSSTTKLRVVFNASHKTAKGKSLNDLLMVGPTIQDTIFDILLRWRTHKVAVIGDIEKMFRQILIHPEDRDFQRIVWRPTASGPIKHYRLNTVTHGTACAPYQAVRTLHQLATDEKLNYPLAHEVVTRDFYVDDLLSGTSDPKSAAKLVHDVKSMLATGGMKIRKWASNIDEALEGVAPDDRAASGPITIDTDNTVKTLGLLWNPKEDNFSLKVNTPDMQPQSITKRVVSSAIARLYDPLGWLQPTVIIGKALLQQLWLEKVDWDQCLSTKFQQDWLRYIEDCPALETIKIPRYTKTKPFNRVEIHGFCDASMKAYAAVVYLRVKSSTGEVHVSLLTAKSKVAPLKTQSIPRLELNAAVLLSKLVRRVKQALRRPQIPIYCWTDSTVVLAWLNEIPSRWNVYVANRVSEIQTLTNISDWRHVRTEQNPADCASRGMLPSRLIQHSLWWNGPEWLRGEVIDYDAGVLHHIDLERRNEPVVMTVIDPPDNILLRFSSFSRLLRVVAYCRRLKHRPFPTSYLTSEELKQAANICAKLSQLSTFTEEIRNLKIGKPISSKSKILALNPFLDAEGVLRVGGRLQNAEIREDQKHPILISPDCKLAELIVQSCHERTLHGSQQLMIANIRREFWIPKVQKLVKTCIHKCMKCFKVNAQTQTQMMGNLPKVRVTPARAFSNTGLDFAGPLTIKWSSGRGAKTVKAYIALFVCLSTKAVHLEVVSDLTSAACIAAIKRFVARRGLCKHIYSDCGTNFIGADKVIRKQFDKVRQETQAHFANEHITWHFNPPSSPHFGGLWEAGVKSMKTHLIKTIGSNLLNIEELYTVLAQIEAILNSRPLTPVSNDINDEEALTPGHFLIGQPLIAIPEERPSEDSRLLRKWLLTKVMVDQFWVRWSNEYLSRLQQRPKWMKPHENLRTGQLVLVKDENYPPTKWPLARILEAHPGNDGIVRVATVKLRGKVTKRPVVKLSPLPIPACEDSSSEEPKPETSNTARRLRSSPVEKENQEVNGNIENNPDINSQPTQAPVYSNCAGNNNKDMKLAELVRRFNSVKTSKKKRRSLPTKIPVRPPIEKLMADQEFANPAKKKQRITQSSTGFLLTMLIVVLGFPLTMATNTSIIPVSSGIIVEHLGEAFLNKGTLQLNIQIPWKNLEKDDRDTQGVIDGMAQLCKSGLLITKEIHCGDLVDHLRSTRKEIQHKLHTIHFVKHRQRRGVLGSLLTAIFGVNNEVYQDIDSLATNQKSLRQALDKESKLILRTMHSLKQTNAKVETKLMQFEQKLNVAIKLINQYSNWYSVTDHNKIDIMFLGTYQRAINFLNEVLSKYSAILTCVYTKQGILDLIQPGELIHIINKTEEVLPPSLELSHTVLNKLAIQYQPEALFISGYLPILDRRSFDLIKATAVPRLTNNQTFVSPEISPDILGANFDLQTYFEISEPLFRQQMELADNKFLVRLNTLYNMRNKPNCVIKEVYHSREGPNCSNRYFKLGPSTNIIWKQLYSRDKWMFIAHEPTLAHQTCQGKRTEVLLNGTGILSLAPDCSFTTSQHILSTEKQEQRTVLQLLLKPLNITPAYTVKVVPHLNVSTILKPSDTFSSLIDQAQQNKEALEAVIQKRIRAHHGSSALIVLSPVLIIIIFILLLFYYNRDKPLSTSTRTRWFDPETTHSIAPQ